MIKAKFYSTKHRSNTFAYIYYQVVFNVKKGMNSLLFHKIYNSNYLFFTRKTVIMKDISYNKFKYKHYKKAFDFKNKLYNYIRGQIYHKLTLILILVTFAINLIAIITITTIIIIIIEISLLTTHIITFIINFLKSHFISPTPVYRINLSIIYQASFLLAYRAVLSNPSNYRANTPTTLSYNSKSYFIVRDFYKRYTPQKVIALRLYLTMKDLYRRYASIKSTQSINSARNYLTIRDLYERYAKINFQNNIINNIARITPFINKANNKTVLNIEKNRTNTIYPTLYINKASRIELSVIKTIYDSKI